MFSRFSSFFQQLSRRIVHPQRQQHDQRVHRLIGAIKVLASLSYRNGNLNHYLQEITENVSQLMEIDWSVVTLCKGDAERILASSLDIGEAMNQVYYLHGTLTGTVASLGRPLVVSDATQITEYGSCPNGYRAYLGVPLRLPSGEVIGTICSFQHQVRQFSEEEVYLAELFAERAATAIDNYQLYQKQQQSNEQLSLANAELAKVTRLKDEFLSTMSHELRTPLTAIIGLAEVLKEEVYGNLTSKQEKSVNTIEESGRHLLELINDLLDLSKIESGKMELQYSSVSPHTLTESSLIFVRQQAQNKQITLINKIPQDLTVIQADERRMRQIFINLLSNAVKFTPDGGQISLEATEDVGKQITKISVIDTGIGIKIDHLDQLFQPFVQLDSSFSRRYAGTGLGLALVHRLADLHGGSVAVESEINQGSRFSVILPWKLPQSSSEKIEDSVSSFQFTSTTPSILLVEDNEKNLAMMKTFLEAEEFRVLLSRNGLEAIKIAQDQIPDLIIIDLQIPELDGLEAIRRIRTQTNLKTIPIIALTSIAISPNLERCLKAGANHYCVKPIQLDILKELICQYFS